MEKLRLELPNQPPPRLVAQKESNEIEVQNLPVGAVCGGDLSIAETDSKALNRLRGA
jgi:hypothetical protein